MNDCENMYDMIDAYLDDELTSEQRERLAAHLEACPECTARLRLMLMMREMAPELAEDAPDGFTDGVMQRVRALDRETAPYGAAGANVPDCPETDADAPADDGELEAEPEPPQKKRRFYPMPFTMVAAAAVLMIFCFQSGFFGLLSAPPQTDIAGNMGVTFSLEGDDSALRKDLLSEYSSVGGGDGAMWQGSAQTTVGYTIAATTAMNSMQPDMMSPFALPLPGLAPLEAYENGLYQFVFYIEMDSVPQDVYAQFISTLSELPNTYGGDHHYYIVTREQYDELYALLPDVAGVIGASAENYPHLLDETVPYGAVVFY